jgi:carbonic anhydrase
MKHLLSGLRKFSEEIFPQKKKFFEALSSGQKPHTLMITCSDSRIDPNLVTQTKPGELFVLRNTGNIVPPFGSSRGGEEAAIEFAVDGLGVSNIVICGHSQCGAMAALLNESYTDDLPSVRQWLGHAQATKKRILDLTYEVDMPHIVEENVLVQAENIRTHPSVSAALRSGRVHLFGWIYNFETGVVSVYDPRVKRYLPSVEVCEESHHQSSHFAL